MAQLTRSRVQVSRRRTSILFDIINEPAVRHECMNNILVPLSPSGIVTSRTLLSALPDANNFDDGLNRITVEGKSWALRILRRG